MQTQALTTEIGVDEPSCQGGGVARATYRAIAPSAAAKRLAVSCDGELHKQRHVIED